MPKFIEKMIKRRELYNKAVKIIHDFMNNRHYTEEQVSEFYRTSRARNRIDVIVTLGNPRHNQQYTQRFYDSIDTTTGTGEQKIKSIILKFNCKVIRNLIHEIITTVVDTGVNTLHYEENQNNAWQDDKEEILSKVYDKEFKSIVKALINISVHTKNGHNMTPEEKVRLQAKLSAASGMELNTFTNKSRTKTRTRTRSRSTGRSIQELGGGSKTKKRY
jgi:hypothetical protein